MSEELTDEQVDMFRDGSWDGEPSVMGLVATIDHISAHLAATQSVVEASEGALRRGRNDSEVDWWGATGDSVNPEDIEDGFYISRRTRDPEYDPLEDDCRG